MSYQAGQSLTTHQNPTRLTWIGALIHGNLWKDRHRHEWGNNGAKFLLCGSFMASVLCIPLMCFISHLLRWTCRDFRSDDYCTVALPSKRPSSPDGSLKMVELLQRHIKYDQSVFPCIPVTMTAFAPQQHDIRTHSWCSHEDSGDHNLRNGLLRSFWWLS